MLDGSYCNMCDEGRNDESTELHERITVCAFAQFSTCRDANYHQEYTVIVDNYDRFSKMLYLVSLFFTLIDSIRFYALIWVAC